jgi:hypothetical protein
MRLSKLDSVPAAFLNRFEKYRLSQVDLLLCRARNLDETISGIFHAAMEKVKDLESLMGTRSFYGSVPEETIGSIFLDLLSCTVNAFSLSLSPPPAEPPSLSAEPSNTIVERDESFVDESSFMEQLRSYVQRGGLPIKTAGKGRTKDMLQGAKSWVDIALVVVVRRKLGDNRAETRP